MTFRDTKVDIKEYENYPDRVRLRFANREYPEEDELFIREWLRAKKRREKLSYLTNRILDGCYSIAFLALLIPVGQAAIWLYKGYWVSLPFIKLLYYLNLDFYTIENPKTWVGLAEIINWFMEWWVHRHVSLHIFFYSILMGSIISYLVKRTGIFILEFQEKVPKMKK